MNRKKLIQLMIVIICCADALGTIIYILYSKEWYCLLTIISPLIILIVLIFKGKIINNKVSLMYSTNLLNAICLTTGISLSILYQSVFPNVQVMKYVSALFLILSLILSWSIVFKNSKTNK